MKRLHTAGAIALALTITAFGCSKTEQKPKAEETATKSESATAEKKADGKKAEATKPVAAKGDKAEKPSGKASISKEPYGKTEDGPVDLYTLVNEKGLKMKVTNYGAIITEFHVPDHAGKMADIVAGYDSLDGYLKLNPYFGSTVGRIANRIKDGKFTLEGKQYTLATNNGPHHLHGGKKGWDKVVWTAKTEETDKGPAIHLSYTSPDGEEGYPGTVKANVTYTLTNDNQFLVDMEATTDKTTIVNMAHHTYWNLAGQSSGTILDEVLQIHADKYTPGKVFKPDSDPVPFGEEKSVDGTPFDFTSPKPIGKDNQAVGGKPVGYDNNWIINGEPNKMRPVAVVKDPKSGRVLTLEADKPGLQFYAGIFLDGTIEGKGGAKYPQYGFFCLETQAYPNAINVPAWKDQVILKPGETYSHHMIHRFTTEEPSAGAEEKAAEEPAKKAAEEPAKK
jgi:aldose 1-epimerase